VLLLELVVLEHQVSASHARIEGSVDHESVVVNRLLELPHLLLEFFFFLVARELEGL